MNENTLPFEESSKILYLSFQKIAAEEAPRIAHLFLSRYSGRGKGKVETCVSFLARAFGFVQDSSPEINRYYGLMRKAKYLVTEHNITDRTSFYALLETLSGKMPEPLPFPRRKELLFNMSNPAEATLYASMSNLKSEERSSFVSNVVTAYGNTGGIPGYIEFVAERLLQQIAHDFHSLGSGKNMDALLDIILTASTAPIETEERGEGISAKEALRLMKRTNK